MSRFTSGSRETKNGSSRVHQDATKQESGLQTPSSYLYHRELPQPPTGSLTLAEALARGQQTAAVTFAGQGAWDLDALAQWMQRFPSVRSLVELATEKLQALIQEREFRWTGKYTHGFDLLNWAIDPKVRPPVTYLQTSTISQALIFVQQVACYQMLWEEGLQKAFQAGSIRVLTGHSQGIMPALLVSESDGGQVSPARFLDYVVYMLWQGLYMYESYGDAKQDSSTEISPMAAVSGPSYTQLQETIKRVLQTRPATESVTIALRNTRLRHVLSGPPSLLEQIRQLLNHRSAKETRLKKEGRLAGKPFSIVWEYLIVEAPYHSPYMESGLQPMREKLTELGFRMSPDAFHIDVLSPHSGTNFRTSSDPLELVLQDQFIHSVNWHQVLQKVATHQTAQEEHQGVDMLLDLGPGDGVSRLSYSVLKGTGLRVLPLATPAGRDEFLVQAFEELPQPLRYKDFLPTLQATDHGQLQVRNRYTQATGHAPIILPGMTPTTADVGIVAAAANAGFTAELAGGGQVTEPMFWLRMEELQAQLDPGREVVFNALFLDPYLWGLHFRKEGLVQQARAAGFPLCGVTISAGIPEVEEAVKLLHEFHSLGLWLNAFKPGTLQQVKQVIQIARAVPQQTIFVHLEGGKAGGHHSWENLDDLLLDCYHMLREQPNLVLCVGGGVGTEERSTSLLDGTWSQQYGLIPMPVDAVFLGTLAMACLEAETSPQVKQALVDAAGCPDWVLNGEFKDGLTSGKSALNADIHYLDNPASRCGHLLDKVAGDAEAVAQHRDEIIEALNATAKPYLGDLEEMTYLAVAQRMLSLMAVGRNGRYEDGRWLDRSYRTRWADFIQRTEARLRDQEEGTFQSIITDQSMLEQPEEVLSLLVQEYPEAAECSLHPADVQFFLHKICARPGKPVNFVPVINENVRRWYKSDSLWQAHDDRFEADQVLILPGPEAIAGLKQVDEPIADLLGRFTKDLEVSLISKQALTISPKATLTEVPDMPTGFNWGKEGKDLTIFVQNPESPTAWFSTLHENYTGPLAQLFRSPRIFVGQRSLPNPLFALLLAKPGAGLTIECYTQRRLTVVTYRPVQCSPQEEVRLTLEEAENVPYKVCQPQVKMEVWIPGLSGETENTPYTLLLTPENSGSSYFFTQTETERRHAIRSFYHQVLFGALLEPTPLFETAEDEVSLSLARVRGYHAVTGGQATTKEIPLNMMFSMVWKPLFRTLSCDELVGDIMQLVHLNNRVTIVGEQSIQADQQVTVQSKISRLEDSAQGRTVHTTSLILQDNKPCVLVESAFFIRGSFAHTPFVVQANEELQASTPVPDQATWEFVREHRWIKWLSAIEITPETALDWELQTKEQRPRQGKSHYSATGVIKHNGQLLGTVGLDTDGDEKQHPVHTLLGILGTNKPVRHDCKRSILAREQDSNPQHLETFAEISRDGNPIHRSTLIARLGGLEQTIVHGMWTAARLGEFLTKHVAGGEERRLQNVHAEFLAYSLPGESLVMEATRTGVIEGDLLVEATAFVLRETQKIPVVRLETRITAPRTAYVFPGQGIQQKGMGMAGYARSKAARDVWDRCDTYTRRHLGFSILHIVRENPNEVIVQGVSQRHPQGVLHLTQFTQVAMAVLAQAQTAEMKESGVHHPDAVICGHSVGEYNAIAVTGVLPLETVVELVYQRGLVMHVLVERNAQGESGYGMAVIRPHYAKMNHKQAEQLVEQIKRDTGHFLQIVNYNVKGRQYSVTGRIEALRTLEQELATRTHGGKPAYIEIPGIDVPFHSAVLRDGVAQFRTTLEDRFPQELDYAPLLGRYIPNLVPRAFSLDSSYIQEVAEYTQSSVLLNVMKDFAHWQQKPAALARVLLIELLAWQFASPVRWIETQELLFTPQSMGGIGAEQIIEIGVGYQPTLANMARYTLQLLGPAAPSTAILNVEAEAELVFFQDEGELEEFQMADVPLQGDQDSGTEVEAENEPSDTKEAKAKEPQQVQASIASEVIAATAPIGENTPVEDRAMTAAEAVRVLLALQAKVRLDQVRDDETIDELFDGVSSRRNQVLLDLGAEFNMGPIDGAHEKPLHQLTAEVEKRASSYKAPGKYLRAAQDEAIKRALGRAGMSRKDICDYLDSHYGLGEGLCSTVQLHLALETREGESKRGDQLGRLTQAIPTNKSDAKMLLDQAVTSAANHLKLPLPKKAVGQGTGGAAVDAAVVKELEERILGPRGVLMNTAKQIAQELGHTLKAEDNSLTTKDEQAERLALWEKEHGADYEQWIHPRFDARKHVALTSSWAWIARDIAEIYYDVTNGRIELKEAEYRASRLSLHSQEGTTQETAHWYMQQAREEGNLELSQLLEKIATGQSLLQAPCLPTRPHLEIDNDGSIQYSEVTQHGADAYTSMLSTWFEQSRIKVKGWSEELRGLLEQVVEAPFNFRGETALVTGASPGSIAVVCVRHLLRGGARVVVTTSTYNSERIRFYRSLYEQEAAPGAELHIVPFNQSSFQDVKALIQWLFSTRSEQSGAEIRVTKRPFAPSLFLPFAAVKDLATLDTLGSRSNIVMRAMLLSVERMIAAIASHYQQHGLPASPCHVVLPLSPNHGTFGGDGVYAETKAALEVLQQKWFSEYNAWGRAVTLCAARIGWVRGTGLMDANNPVAARLEEQTGVTTFSSPEMGLLLSALCTQEARQMAQAAPLQADLSGGFADIDNLKEIVDQIRQEMEKQQQQIRRKQTLLAEESRQLTAESNHTTELHALPQWPMSQTLEHFAESPTPKDESNEALLAQTVVIVGTGEIGPCGSSRTRFALEVDESLSPAGILELAWVTGLLVHEDNGRGGVWKDTKTGEEVAEWEIASRYREAVRERVGIRFCEEQTLGFEPQALPVYSSVYLEQDFTFPVASAEEARSFVKAAPELTQANYDATTDTWNVTRRAGSEIRIPRQARLSRHVAGMVPQGFNFERFGIPKEMLDQVDRVSLFNLVATVDAFISAGLTPEELMQWVHPARVANTQGSGIGGMQSLKRLYTDHVLGQERQSDVLQETLINVVAAYVVQSYVGSYGAMSHPVAACATAAVSLEDGMDKILAGKADFVVSGGYDDIGEAGMIGFGDMNATADTDQMLAMGLEPSQISRANDVRRRGFVEAQGGGTILLARGDVALRMGLPVHGVLGYAASFGDGIHKSIPAPGMGALACAMGGQDSPLAQALQRYGMSADDIAMVYKHDTSTAANDPNENQLHHRIQKALGRTPGNPLFVVSQKSLTGHPKGGAAAWQAIGLCQSLQTGVIPGNRNLDSVDEQMKSYTHMAFSNRSLHVGKRGLRAGLITSLGFGHVSGISLILHPDTFVSLLSAEQRHTYLQQAQLRSQQGQRDWAAIQMGRKQAFTKRSERRFEAVDGTPVQAEEEAQMLLDPEARLNQSQRYIQ